MFQKITYNENGERWMSLRCEKIRKEFGIYYGLKYYVTYWLHKNCFIKCLSKRVIKLRYRKRNLYVRMFSTDLDFLENIYIGSWHNGVYRGEYEIKGASDCEAYVDLGANIGLFAVLYGLRYPNKTIISVEPETSNYVMLKRNTTGMKNVVCINKAVWYKDAYVKVCESKNIQYPSNTPSEGGFYVRECGDKDENAVYALSINSIINRFKIDNYMIKMDVEGAEYAIFEKGNNEWLQNCKVLAMETHDRFSSKYNEKNIFEVVKRTHWRKQKVGENEIFVRK